MCEGIDRQPTTVRDGERGMTLFAGSMAHVCAAGLALAAGYGAAAMVGAPLPAVPRPLSARDRRRAQPETAVPVLRTALVMPELPALPMPEVGVASDAPPASRLTTELERPGVMGFGAQLLEDRPLVP